MKLDIVMLARSGARHVTVRDARESRSVLGRAHCVLRAALSTSGPDPINNLHSRAAVHLPFISRYHRHAWTLEEQDPSESCL